MLADVLWTMFALSIWLTIRALMTRNWVMMSFAAICLAPFIISSFALYTIPLGCLQIAAALALKHEVPARAWPLYLLTGVGVCAVIRSGVIPWYLIFGDFALFAWATTFVAVLLLPWLPMRVPNPFGAGGP